MTQDILLGPVQGALLEQGRHECGTQNKRLSGADIAHDFGEIALELEPVRQDGADGINLTVDNALPIAQRGRNAKLRAKFGLGPGDVCRTAVAMPKIKINQQAGMVLLWLNDKPEIAFPSFRAFAIDGTGVDRVLEGTQPFI